MGEMVGSWQEFPVGMGKKMPVALLGGRGICGQK